ncbi:hypothetical protein JHK85_047460 [Glycine max]|uniref:Uncharacterized protein n=1 Tax=Glycine max TaxID=3847 RepID=A0A0R0FKE3_SOYBN|nr:hypothetical protein JHK85_047460 [Glycine max]KAH1117573.1 hypothetical protein GYH30_046718 [Glycine max]
MVSDVEVIYEAPIRTRTPDTTRTWTRTRTRGHLKNTPSHSILENVILGNAILYLEINAHPHPLREIKWKNKLRKLHFPEHMKITFHKTTGH